jgi:Na+-transporting NADH:ubiquinone oxidoreductase subunit NqrF
VFFEKIRFEVQLDGSGIIQIRFDYQTVNAFVWNTETTKYHENLDAMNYFQQKETIDNSVFWSYDLFYNTFCQISQNKAFRMIKSNYFSDFEITN